MRNRTERWCGVVCGVALGAAAWVMVPGCETVRDTFRGVRDEVTTPAPSGPRDAEVYTSEPEIRVRVARQVREQEVSGAARFVVRAAPDSLTGVSRMRPEVIAGPLTVASGPGGVVTVNSAGERREWGFGIDLGIVPTDGSLTPSPNTPQHSVLLNGKPYPGFVTVRPRWNDDARTMDVTVSMPLEAYLPGVLSKELFNDWPRQSFEAQAVAARTYALFERGRARAEKRTADVEDTTADQVFGGTSNLVRAAEAVRATRGWVVTDRGRLIRAYYSSLCGGRPASAGEAWRPLPTTEFNRARPLQGRTREAACQSAPLYRWTTARPIEDVNTRLRAWGRGKNHGMANLARVRGIEPASRNDAGRPNTYTVTDDRGNSYTLTAEELREACNWPVGTLPPITRENRLHSGDVEVSVWANEVRFSGRGFGHGVGMCQWCSKGMAERGKDWRTMIDLFYPGGEVKKLY